MDEQTQAATQPFVEPPEYFVVRLMYEEGNQWVWIGELLEVPASEGYDLVSACESSLNQWAKDTGISPAFSDYDRLSSHNSIEGVPYFEAIVSTGGRYQLIGLDGFTDEQMKVAEEALRHKVDVVSCYVLKLRKAEGWEPPAPAIICQNWPSFIEIRGASDAPSTAALG